MEFLTAEQARGRMEYARRSKEDQYQLDIIMSDIKRQSETGSTYLKVNSEIKA